MESRETIQINRLLRKREEIYADIFSYEEQIFEALGQRLPIAPPPELPSIFRAPKKAKKKNVKGKQIRKLKPQFENAYKLTFINEDEEKVDYVRDVRLVRRLMTFEIPFFQLIKIETVIISGNNNAETIEILHDNSTEIKQL